MEARWAHGSTLKRVFEALKDMVNDVNLECSASGIKLQAMDASHVSLASLCLHREAFEKYSCDQLRTLGLSMQMVSKVFRLCGNDDTVTIRHNNDSDIVTFVFESSGEERISDFDLKLMQIDQEHLGVPDTDFASTIRMPSKQLQKVIQELGSFSDTISIEVTSKCLTYSVKGDSGSGSVVIKSHSSDTDPVEIKTKQDQFTLSFATRYLQIFTKATPLSDHVILKLSPQQPLNVTFPLESDSNIGHLTFFLAPKMDDDMVDDS